MCRKPFSLDQIEQNIEIDKNSLDSKKFNWFYEGKNQGFWAFDERSSEEIEQAFVDNKNHLLINIAGYTYCIDFQNMIQYPQHKRNRIRKIKRCEDLSEISAEIKGVAGVRVAESNSINENNQQCDEASGLNPIPDLTNLSLKSTNSPVDSENS
jgi:E3 ubiquitin-protein ligase RNF146